MYLLRGKDIPEGWGGLGLARHDRFALTDGGVLENLGVQTLLKSQRFGAWDLVISDAGRTEAPWKPGGIANSLRGLIMGALTLPTIVRVTAMMNAKENRHMRSTAFGELEHSWLVDAIRTNESTAALKKFVASAKPAPRRRILFIRLDQTLSSLLATIPRWRIVELAERAQCTLPDSFSSVLDVLKTCGVDLAPALNIHQTMGGDARIAELNRIGTHFSALSGKDIQGLHDHALWQLHAMKALYWE